MLTSNQGAAYQAERATSNICSNQALNALAAVVYLSWQAKRGLGRSLVSVQKTAYLADRIADRKQVQPRLESAVFQRVRRKCPVDAAGTWNHCLSRTSWQFPWGAYPNRQYLLIAVGREGTRQEMDALGRIGGIGMRTPEPLILKSPSLGRRYFIPFRDLMCSPRAWKSLLEKELERSLSLASEVIW